ncbi:uncharacterized protein H6S33_005035 [Morchella sextelata]|uniref:uncharacterized protein n=1 Tax=Morchella sextelata TaxID=1174677 RepID=UPI001D057AF6|nr:uncharacterized protein H6S33_005035 [Morchella sextelata]KAH0605053.1 hypothetical protein H6S33_005035 [Morchella sextelata]
MGLAGPRNRTKIGADPRNTNWSNNTDRFGHRILTTLGWQPGSTLGDTSSLYHQSGHITAASAAGVKIVLKDDNLGIGCNKRQREDECVGLDGLQSLLGRLNGKGNDELEKEAETRDKLRRDVIVGERYGMRFVRGETYVSSDIDTLLKKIKLEGEKEAEVKVKVEVKEEEELGEKKRKSKKEAKVKKETKVKKEESESEPEMAAIPITPSDESSSVRIKKEKKEKTKREKSSSKSESATPVPGDDSDSKSKKRKRTDEDSTEKNKDKKDRVSKKSKNGETHEQRKERRTKEKKAREARRAEKKDKKKKKSKSSSSDSDSSEDESTPAASGTATPSGYSALVGRQAVRHRFIAAKRSAVMDAKALNEIFMIKA